MKKLKVEELIKIISDKDNFNFRYLIRSKHGNWTLANELPKKVKGIDIIDFEKCKKVFMDFEPIRILDERLNAKEPVDAFNQNAEMLVQFNKLIRVLEENEMVIPYGFAKLMDDEVIIDSFADESFFGFFKNELPNINEELAKFSEGERINFYKYANSIGCFRLEALKGQDETKGKSLVAQKASSLLANIIKTRTIPLGAFENLFFALNCGTQVDQEFLQFAAMQNRK